MTDFVCELCQRKFETKQSYAGHKSSCGKSGNRYSVTRVLAHTKKQHTVTYNCKFCDRSTTNAGANRVHENACEKNPSKPIKCTLEKRGRSKGFTGQNQFTKAIRLGLPKPVGTTKGRESPFKGKTHSPETKQKLSAIRKEFIENNPDKSPWVYSHWTKRRSYPERYWKKIFDVFGVDLQEQYRVSRYCLDFACLTNMVDIEVDGEQHYLDPRVVQIDKRRNEFLQDNGWKVIRIRWSDYMKLCKTDRKTYVLDIIKEIQTRGRVDKGT